MSGFPEQARLSEKNTANTVEIHIKIAGGCMFIVCSKKEEEGEGVKVEKVEYILMFSVSSDK